MYLKTLESYRGRKDSRIQRDGKYSEVSLTLVSPFPLKPLANSKAVANRLGS